MKSYPLILSTSEVRAVLNPTKTQHRVRVKPQPVHVVPFIGRDNKPTHEFGLCLEFERVINKHVFSPFGVPGDLLWVRETFAECGGQVVYRADNPDGYPGANFQPWRSPLAMPRHLSRLTLEVESVRVQRVQDISEEDARAEGVTPFPRDPDGDCWTDGTHRTAFNYAWNEKHGWLPDAWHRNDWVWVVEFRRLP